MNECDAAARIAKGKTDVTILPSYGSCSSNRLVRDVFVSAPEALLCHVMSSRDNKLISLIYKEP